MSDSEVKFGYRGMEYTIGTLLTIISVTGVISNIVSFTYFKTTKTKNKNRRFFKNLYMMISLNDVMLSAALIPAIEALFTRDRKSVILSANFTCSASFTLWWILSQNSIILVSVLSVTRLWLLKYTSTTFAPLTAYLVPLTAALLFLVLAITSISTDTIYTFYNKEFVDCTFNSFPMDNLTGHVTVTQQVGAIVATTLYNSIATTCFNVVTISFIMSLMTLKTSGDAADRLGTSSTRQREATKTVIIVTLVYIVCNLPFMLIMMYVMIDIINDLPNDTKTVHYVKDRYFTYIFGVKMTFLNQYACLIANKLFVSLNCLINPLVYLFRLKGFKIYLQKLFKMNNVEPLSISNTRSDGT